MLYYNKGFTLVEVVVAMAITGITLVSLLGMIPLSWNVARNSDQVGRAAGIIQAEMARREDAIMRANVPVASVVPLTDVNNQLVAGQNINFYVTTRTCAPNNITAPCHNTMSNAWVIKVDVNWDGCGINPCSTNSRVVSQQMG